MSSRSASCTSSALTWKRASAFRSGSISPSSAKRTTSPCRSSSPHSGHACEGVGRRRLCERRLHVRERAGAEVVDRVDELEPAFADEADAIGDVLHLGQDVRREEDRAAAPGDLRDELVERLLDERIEPARRLVEHEQVGIVHERLDEPDLLPVPARQLLDPAVEIEVEPLGELVAASRRARRAGARRSGAARGRSSARTGGGRRAGSRAGGGSRRCRVASRARRRSAGRSSGGSGRAAGGSSSSCLRRSGRGTRIPRRPRPRSRRRRCRGSARSSWSAAPRG